MARITKLTPEQERALPIFREDCRARALRPHFATDAEMREAVVNLYIARGLKSPKVYAFADPVQCLWARAILRSGRLDQLGDQLGGQLRDQLWDQLWDQLGGQLRGQLGGQLRNSHDTLWFAGGSEFYWIAFYEFARGIGVKYTNDQSAALDAWRRYAEVCGSLYPYDGVAFVSRRPDVLAFDEAGRLHRETGAAIEFPSGYGVYAWHGTRVPAHWIEGRATLDPVEVLKTENVDQRHAGCQIIGWARMSSLLGEKIIEGDPESDMGALIELTLPGLPEPGRFLKARCPRNGTICEGVPRISDIDSLPIETALAAQAWRIGDPQSEYQHPPVRT